MCAHTSLCVSIGCTSVWLKHCLITISLSPVTWRIGVCARLIHIHESVLHAQAKRPNDFAIVLSAATQFTVRVSCVLVFSARIKTQTIPSSSLYLALIHIDIATTTTKTDILPIFVRQKCQRERECVRVYMILCIQWNTNMICPYVICMFWYHVHCSYHDNTRRNSNRLSMVQYACIRNAARPPKSVWINIKYGNAGAAKFKTNWPKFILPKHKNKCTYL